jgi:uncharacterized protein (TIGR03435 family)
MLAKGWATGMSNLLLVAVLLFSAAVQPFARAQASSVPQAPSAETTAPAYDVMSIKPNRSGSGSMSMNSNGDRYSATNVSLKNMLQGIYDIKEDLIFGLPGPIDSARFDIETKIVNPDPDVLKKLSTQQRRMLLLPLLAERFQLKTHTEIRTLPVYDLVVLQGGPKFKQSSSANEHGGGIGVNGSGKTLTLTAHDLPMASIAKALANPVHRTVIDRTGLTGNYDLTLHWSPEDSSDTETDSAASIFTAFQEQLGLKLQPAKGPVETLVVDHVQMPSEN